MENKNTIDFRRVAVLTVITAAVNASIFGIGNLSGATWDVGQPFLVGIFMVLGASIAPMILGALVTKALAAKWSTATKRLAWGVLLFSVAGAPLGWIQSGDTATGIALGLMHITVGLGWFFAIKPNNA